MTSPLSEARSDLAARLAAAPGFSVFDPEALPEPGTVPVSDFVPEAILPPIAFVGPGAPYVEGSFTGMNFGETRVNLTITLVVDAGANSLQATALDDLVVNTIDFIESQDPELIFEDVDRPAAVTLNGQRYLGCLVNLSRIVRLRP